MRFIRQKELVKKVGRSRTSIWRDERLGLFPPRRKIGKNSVAWVEEEIELWMVNQIKVSNFKDTGDDFRR